MQQLDNPTVLVFDTETTGLPIDWKRPFTDTENWPRIVQFGMILQSPDGTQESFESLVKPNGSAFPIPEAASKVHGITDEKCINHGIPIEDVVGKFLESYAKADILICHNTDFDFPVLSCEMVRLGIKPEKREVGILCTKKTTTDLLQLPGHYGFKWPTLQELHRYLFGCEFEGSHDALSDVQATLNCYNELAKRGKFIRGAKRNQYSYSLNK
jgi:DNA polymerase-3 subunit epsilon